jgi:hypothetical protein
MTPGTSKIIDTLTLVARRKGGLGSVFEEVV